MKKEIYKQLVHKRCGGEIILIGDTKKQILFLCRECKNQWGLSIKINMPQDIRFVKSSESKTI